LFVEDDHFVLKFLKQVMPEFVQGPLYFAKSAEEALGIWREHNDTIEVLFTDLSLPGMSGEQRVVTLVFNQRAYEINSHLVEQRVARFLSIEEFNYRQTQA
jgi:CheY-like chemotaxis protein